MIKFYSHHGDFGCFSNFSNHSIKLDGKIYKTTENYFQSKKFEGTEIESKIRKCHSPNEAALLGRSRKFPLRRDWESVKDNVMRKAVLAKFSQHQDLRDILVDTGDEKLIEHTENDKYWADGGNGSGKNMLGIILMEIREAIKSTETINKYIEKFNL